jgi:hypothetical protein
LYIVAEVSPPIVTLASESAGTNTTLLRDRIEDRSRLVAGGALSAAQYTNAASRPETRTVRDMDVRVDVSAVIVAFVTWTSRIAAVGTAVGPIVGNAGVAAVGSAVSTTDGTAEVAGVGTPVGTFVSSVGVAEGATVGTMADGAVAFPSAGLPDGLSVGAQVGCSDGKPRGRPLVFALG